MIVLRHTVLPPWLSCDGFGARDLAECAKAYYTLSGFAKLEIDAWFVEFFCARHDFLVASDFIAPCLQEGLFSETHTCRAQGHRRGQKADPFYH